MRTKYTIINSIVGVIGQVILACINFILRRVFVNTIGLEYLGVNGLFSNILSFLALTESGVGIAMAYSLYLPIVNNDNDKINALMKFYKKIYTGIALGITLLGLILIPILPYLIKDSIFTNQEIVVYYLFFLTENVSSYFLAYKSTFLNACQKNYIVTFIRTISMSLGLLIKIFVLYYTGNFLIYLTISVLTMIINNIFISIYVTHHYPYISEKTSMNVEEKDKLELIKNIKGLFMHKIGAFAVFGTDNIIISMFVNLKMVGIYSNYSMVLSQLNMLASQLFNAVIPSMGNYIASAKCEKVYDMYKSIQCINFLLYGTFSSILICVIQPFIKLWIGGEGLLATGVVYLLITDFYLKGMRNTVQIVKTAGGVFYQDRFAPLIEAVANLVVSIFLARRIGIAGVFIGTIVSGLLAPFWITPFYVYRDLLKIPFIEYIKDSFFYLILLLITCFCGNNISEIIIVNNLFLNIIIQAVFIAILTVLIYIIALHKKKEFIFLIEKVKSIMRR